MSAVASSGGLSLSKYAAPNSSEDQSAGLQAAINDAEKYGALHVAKGTYIAHGLSISAPIRFYGDGRFHSAIKPPPGSTLPMLTIRAEVSEVEGIRFDHTDATHGAVGAYADLKPIISLRADVAQISGCDFINAALDGINADGASNGWIFRNRFWGAGRAASQLQGTNTGMRSTENVISSCYGGGIKASSVTTDCLIAHNWISAVGPKADGITAYGKSIESIQVIGNHITNSLHHGIHVGGHDALVSGNTIRGALYSGIYVQTAGGTMKDGASVTGNVVSRSGHWGIFVGGYNLPAVTGNASRNNTKKDILITASCTNAVEAGNATG